jgi:flagellar motor switch protein FliG
VVDASLARPTATTVVTAKPASKEPGAPAGSAAPASARQRGVERAAALLLALGPDVSAQVLRRLSPDAVDGLARSARALQSAPRDVVDLATREFVAEMETFGTGPLTRDVALREIVGAALGEEATRALMSPPQANTPAVQSIVDAEADDVALLLRKEQATTVALVLSTLPADKSALVLQKLPEAMRAPVVRAVFSMSTVSPDLVDDVLEGLAEQVRRFVKAGKRKKLDGATAAMSIVRGLGAEERKTMLGAIEQVDAKLADDIRSKLVSFEDIARMTRKEIQLFLQTADAKVLAVALRGVPPAVVETLLANMSQRAAESFREEMESQGRVRLSQIESAQADLVKIVLRLAEEGKVTLPGQGGEKML